ncbi:phage tail tape measure protein [Psychrobacillus psychrodurans]|uniref:phage tail tape measure protein n=1 Tax=Psychrobacillus psychrodurans TaxID=126157 RepID=UPI0008E73DEE|nr:phage tail tape measure protein [Psychrobacillus psychrodurans]MCZ8541961.1 phage tail tape measure protein [Psychrobacillus psychrodurans]SFN14066.1 phage tail tape measure protein, TP901 family, core region [Psychrobacillus psychrodurans]
MADDVGNLRVGLSLDSATFDQSLKSVDRNLKALGGEMAIIRARGTEWGNSIDGLRTKQNTLSTMLESQDVKVRKLNKSYQRAVQEQGANSQAAENLAVKLNRATAEMTRTETELGQVTSELNRQQAELAQSENAWNQLSASAATAGTALSNAGAKMKDVGRTLTTSVTLPVLAVGAASVKTAMEFEAQMDRVGAIAGATSEEMESLSETALELGANTSKSASEVAKGMEEMAAMGFTANEVIGAMPGVIAAAEASGSDMAQTAEVMASTLNIFSLKAEDASKVADVLATTANISAASLTDMQYALKYAGPPAAALGVSLEELSAGIGIMTNAGMKGEQAGTTLRGALLGLLDPSEENSKRMEKMGIAITDNNGNFVGLSKLIRGLSVALEDQTDTQKAATISALVGKEAVSGMLSLMKAGPDTIDKMTKSLEESGGASAIAAAKMKDNLKGALDELGGSLETAAISIGTALTPTIREASEKIGELVDDFQELSPETQNTIIKMAGLAAAIGPVVLAGGFLASSLGSILKIASPLISVVGSAGLAGSFAALANPIGLTVAGIGLLTTTVGAGLLAYKEANEVNIEVLESKQKEIAKNDELIDSFDSLQSKNRLTNEQMLRYLDIQAELEATTAPEKVAALKDEQGKLLEKSTLTNDQMDEFLGLNQKVIDTAPSTVKAISTQGEAYALNTGALKELNAEKAKELQNSAYETLTKAIEKENGLLKEQKGLLEEINQKNILQQENTNKVSSLRQEIIGHERTILELENQKNGASAQEIIQLDTKITREKDVLLQKNEQKKRAEEMIITYGNQIDKRDEMLGKNRQELAQLEEAKFKYEEIILAQVGITAEKGRGGVQLSAELEKLELQKTKLSELLAAGKIGTAEYQEQNSKIDSQIGKLQSAKSELQLINDVAGKTVFKDVKISETPKNFWDTLDENLRRPITKTVSIRYNNMNGPQEVGYATGTRNAPGGMAWVGEEGPELMYVPKASKIIPNNDSMALLNKWNIPTETSIKGNTSNTKSYQASVVNNFYSPVNSPSENARKITQAQRQMAMEWGLS